MRAGVARYTSMSTAWYLPRQLSSERGRIQRPGGSTGLRSHPIDRLAGPVRSVDGRELSAKCMEPSNYSCHTITTSHQVLRSPCPDAAACMSYRWEDSIGCGKHDMAPGRLRTRSGGVDCPTILWAVFCCGHPSTATGCARLQAKCAQPPKMTDGSINTPPLLRESYR